MSEHVQLRMHGHNVKTMFPHPCSPVCHESKNQHKPPQFPSLDDILSQLENQVCDAVVDKVNEKLPGNIDPGRTTTYDRKYRAILAITSGT
ncbi:hypothetical protein SE959_26045 [Escherichia coli]|nr:hypothetical protein [Escherichia coli]